MNARKKYALAVVLFTALWFSILVFVASSLFGWSADGEITAAMLLKSALRGFIWGSLITIYIYLLTPRK